MVDGVGGVSGDDKRDDLLLYSALLLYIQYCIAWLLGSLHTLYLALMHIGHTHHLHGGHFTNTLVNPDIWDSTGPRESI
jgi:hypothetical protein